LCILSACTPENRGTNNKAQNNHNMHKVLFVTSEAYPLMKTGGLGDVCGSLPAALESLGCDVHLLMPGYRDALAHGGFEPVARLQPPLFQHNITLLEGNLPGKRVKVWLVDYPPAYDRPGNPYHDPYGNDWYDNAARFALLARTAVALALGRTSISWRPDIVHCHDWQTGLVPAWLSLETRRPATVFTIHNLSYQGLFSRDTFTALGLPDTLWSSEALGFHGALSFIKGGVACANQLTTVSPTYAREIQSPEFGCGLDGVLRRRSYSLTGILNGIDTVEWDPAHDAHLNKPYSARRFRNKLDNKLALQNEFGLPPDPDIPVIGMVSRLVYQKGIDLLLGAIPKLAGMPLQMVILGSGETRYEKALDNAAAHTGDRLAVRIGYDETLAHRILASADMILMPSRFEPCGLSQLYSLRYGTVPIVRRIGGLADTVVDATPANLNAGTATGFVFDPAEPAALVAAVARALDGYRNSRQWKKLALNGMRQDFSWRKSAARYLALYKTALGDRQVAGDQIQE